VIMNALDKVKAEVRKRLKNIHDYINGSAMRYKGPKYYESRGRESAYDAILNIIDSLPDEPVAEGLEEELERFIASGDGITIENCGTYKVSYQDFKKVARHFAEWQKEQMMKGAVEGEVYLYESYKRTATAILVDISKEELGDKVRIIVLPKED